MTDIQLISIDRLSLLENNPRKIDKGQFEKLVKNIENDPDFFHARPCLVNQIGDKLTIFAGNQRYRAAKHLGWDSIPCIIYQDLTDEIQRRWTVLDNVHHGEHDFDLLASLYEVDELIDFGFMEKELDIGLPEITDNEDTQLNNKKQVECPNCQHMFTPKRNSKKK